MENATPLPLEGGQGGGVSPEELSALGKLLRENLKPLKGKGNEVFSITPSTAHILFECPRKYYYQQVLQLRQSSLWQALIAPDEELETGDALTFGAQRGTIIHKIFETQLFDRNFSEQERQAAIEQLPEVSSLPPNVRQTMNLDAAIRNAYESYLATGLQQIIANASEVRREYQFQFKSGQAYISGILDLLFLDPADKTWTILDYKSNELDESHIEAEIRKHGYDLQMQLYGLAISRLLQTERVKSILFFTFPGSCYDDVDLSPTALKNLEDRIAAYLEKLSEDIIETCQDEAFCELCEYRLAGAC